jgi:hypothetical protein
VFNKKLNRERENGREKGRKGDLKPEILKIPQYLAGFMNF